MNFRMILKISIKALNRSKVRSVLTMLGIIIGVGSLISMVSLGQGAQMQIQEAIAARGANLLYVRPGSRRTRGYHGGAGTINTLVPADAEAILAECPSVAMASPSVGVSAQVIFGNQNWSTRIEGFNQEFPEIRNWKVAQGTFFDETHLKTAARVAVLGQTVSDLLFPGMDPVGQTMRIRNLPFQVIGVLEKKGQSSWGRDNDDTVVVPYTTVQKKMLGGILNIQSIIISAISARATYTAELQITETLRQRHKLRVGQEEDFQVRNLSEYAEAAAETNQTMTVLLACIAAVSLLVGGIGIMNIMLVAVTERTREIGIRMAIGARPEHIRVQFLVESILLCLFGGMLGVTLGVVGSFAISGLLGWPTLLSSSSIVLGVGFSAMIGIFFGYYPAHKASLLDPIDALRYE